MNAQMSREQALRWARSGLVHSVMEASVVLLFAWSMSLEGSRPALFFVLAVGSSLAFWIVIRMGWTEHLADPSLRLPTHLVDWALRLAFILLLPPLTVIFMLSLLVRYNQAMVHVERRQLAVSWVLLAVASSAVFLQGPQHAEPPGTDTTGVVLLWIFFVLCLLRLAGTGRAFGALREELRQRNEVLGSSAARLLEVADRERLQARERLARELHENLIQELQGLVMNFQAATDRLPHATPAKDRMQSALEQAERVLADSHERVLDLQSGRVVAERLPKALADIACELSRDHAGTFSIRERTVPIPLHDAVADEVFRIGREALINAFQHADATRVDVDLRFDATHFELQVSDNGRGIGRGPIEHGKPDQRGLGIMRDRARRLGGQLDIRTAEAGGTRVALRLPGACAYRPIPDVQVGRIVRLKRRIAALFT